MFGYGRDKYKPSEHDVGWLGYFIGKNKFLKRLEIHDTHHVHQVTKNNIIVAQDFLKGISSNESIVELCIRCHTFLGVGVFPFLATFLNQNDNLSKLLLRGVRGFEVGQEEARQLALALRGCNNKSLKSICLNGIWLDDNSFAELVLGLSSHPQLTELKIRGINFGRNGCVALGTLLRWTTTEIIHLDLTDNDIDDAGLEALVAALAHCHCLETLILSDNPTISSTGWRTLATLFVSAKNLKHCSLKENQISDGVLVAFADALTNNDTLENLRLNPNDPSMTVVGWSAFSQLLCDTSSINATYLSNHTLRYISTPSQVPANVQTHLTLNGVRWLRKKHVAIIKILQHHQELDMAPLFEWDLKALPLVMRWFEQARDIPGPEDVRESTSRKELSVIHQFVRAMPMFFVSKLLLVNSLDETN